MKITPIKLTALEITDAPSLDPIRVFLQDFGGGQGRIILECYGKAWSNFFPGMGQRSLRDFLLISDAEYIEGALHSGQAPKKRDRE
jgi:hypothetical protein